MAIPEEDIYSNYSFLLEKTNKKIKQYAKQQFRALGFEVTVDQWAVLKILAEHTTLNQVTLAQLIHKDTPTVTRILDLLSQKDLILRQYDETDRRKINVCLTSSGMETVNNMLPEVRKIRMHAWQHLSEDDFKQFVRILNTIYDNLKP
ncbi:DNA-binding MarR family transcriptional regulator [Catalinimonas alkaloidigena]|uniref:MarR family winged helix-turn-helix transcriptional regulator n=1 Tax=Catalinimonas alkaloidigena TaxID=1075417 RepID=UPI0024063458|nr:MarR family transcriptional regulator [Catalinimonas alkaloidigena]MDF9795638.1 DNA-binding MarR family transcriptional regulator [Catalinimonas alkaloidigena]